jgi:hypothetical protein
LQDFLHQNFKEFFHEKEFEEYVALWKKKTILWQSQLFKSFLFIDGILDCVFLI